MEKGKKTPPEDITRQPYKGPSQAVAGIGEGAMQAKVLTFVGLAAGGLAAFFAPKQSAKLFESAQKAVVSARTSPNALKKFTGFVVESTLGLGQHAADLITSPKIVKDAIGKFDKKRVTTIIDGSILGAATGSFLGLFTGGAGGVYTARAGRKQFDTAKEEVLKLRQTVAQKDKEIEDIKTAHDAKKGMLKVSSDEIHTDDHHAEQSADEETVQAKTPMADAITKPQASWAGDIQNQNAAKADAQLAL